MNATLFIHCLWIVNLSPSFPCSCLRGPCWHPTTVKPRLTQNSKCFSILNYVSSSAVGRRRPISRLGGAPERHPDVVAPHHCQALPHTAVWVLQPRHPGGSSWGSAEPSCWQLEGRDSAPCSYPCDTEGHLHKCIEIPVGAKKCFESEKSALIAKITTLTPPLDRSLFSLEIQITGKMLVNAVTRFEKKISYWVVSRAFRTSHGLLRHRLQSMAVHS